MRSWMILFALIFNCRLALSQDSFEPGYIVNYSGRQITCLIREPYWKHNPSKIEYKLSFNDTLMEGTIDDIKEFAVGKHTKYISVEVDIDESRDNPPRLDKEKSPRFTKRKLFLRVLVKGRASLYEINTSGYTRFFYQKSDSVFHQLIYKAYQEPGAAIDYNYMFRTQLNKEFD